MKRNYSIKCNDEIYFKFLENQLNIPFSFVYGGKKITGFSRDDFILKDKNTIKIGEKEETVFTFIFDGIIEIKLKLTHYFSHAATEFTVYFKNIGDRNSAVIEEMQIETEFVGENPVLKGIFGDHEKFYEPYFFDLSERDICFTSDTGRATHINFPYFNLEYGNGGTILAIGWSGTWTADFKKTQNGVKYIGRAVNNLKTFIKPNEEIRSALYVMASYSVRDEAYATNYWRDWYVKYNLPKADINGNDTKPFSTCGLSKDTGLPNSDGSISENYSTWKPSIDKMLSENVKVDYRWFDAGWYVRPDGESAQPFVKGKDWWESVGTWELDPYKWPGDTFAQSVEYCHNNGIKTLVWFEPERITDLDNMVKNYGYNPDWAIKIDGNQAISNNIGIEECFNYTKNRICKMLRDNKIDMYREDNNSDPAALWEYLDNKEGENRKGITECKFISAHYRMWDAFIECTLAHGGNGFVDSCASGGGRNDLESMRRGIPLLRSDSDRTTTAHRLSMTTAFNKWIPFCGASTKESVGELDKFFITDRYVLRASYLAALNVAFKFVYNTDNNFDVLRFALKEWKRVNSYILKDFYTLTPWHSRTDDTSFTAFCYFDPETEKGVILAFRQENCEEQELNIKLPFAEKGEVYRLIDEDIKEIIRYSNSENGIILKFTHKRQDRLLWIEK